MRKKNVYCCCNRSEKTDAERILSAQEMKALRDVVQNHLQSNPLYMSDWVIEICMWTGLRVGEVVAHRGRNPAQERYDGSAGCGMMQNSLASRGITFGGCFQKRKSVRNIENSTSLTP